MKEATFWKKHGDAIRCQLCPQLCLIHPHKVGLCLVRYNDGRKLYSLSYGRITSKALDPTEKKPLNNFHPGSHIFSIGGVGCNLGCPFCQNYRISQPKEFSLSSDYIGEVENATGYLPVSELVKEVVAAKPYGNIGVAYTYNEPMMSYEYLLEACKAVKESGFVNVLVTNGYINPKPLNKLLPLIDAMNIDIKGFREDVYEQLGGHLGPVKKTISVASKSCHVELTNLVVPGLNDDKAQIEELVNWIASEVGPSTPLHFSRYFPAHKHKVAATPIETLKMAEKIAKKKLKYVYLGNV